MMKQRDREEVDEIEKDRERGSGREGKRHREKETRVIRHDSVHEYSV